MILLVLVVALWILVLAPSAYRRVSERGGAGSIDHFHHQLDLLEHAGPKLVTPAYRLHTAVPGGAVPLQAEPENSMYRAKLVLLRPVEDEESADIDDEDGVHYARIGVLDSPEPEVPDDRSRIELRAFRRQEARRRCSSLLLVLTGLTISTALLGIMPALRLAWVFTGLTAVALFGLIGLIAYAREIEAQRRRWASPPTWDEMGEDRSSDDDYLVAAESGFPGAWDDEDDYPRQAVGGS